MKNCPECGLAFACGRGHKCKKCRKVFCSWRCQENHTCNTHWKREYIPELLEKVGDGTTTIADMGTVANMVDALLFYANQANYTPFDEAGNTPIEIDFGQKASNALLE